MAINIVSSNY